MDNEFIQDAFFRQWIEQSSDFYQGISLDGRITYVSPSLHKLMGSAFPLIGKPCGTGIAAQDEPLFRQAFRQLVEEQVPLCLEYRLSPPGGSLLWVEGKAHLIREHGAPAGVGLVVRDISRQKLQEERLTHMAYYDPLTGLPNRRLFEDRYSQALMAAKRYQHRVALLYLDLDDFKQINDGFGHAAGDELLRTVSSRLAHCVRDPDTVSRLGGDEFVILLQQFEHRDDIRKVAMRVIDSLNQPYFLHNRSISITCSIGAAEYPQDGSDKEALLQYADAAMYQAKQHGKNYFHS